MPSVDRFLLDESIQVQGKNLDAGERSAIDDAFLPKGQMRMRARIHRGAAEIGGSCVELEAQGRHLVLDLGRPLTADWDEAVPLPDVPGLTDHDPSLLGVLVSHAHPDHYGLAGVMPDHAPFFIGAAAERILRESHFFGAAPDLPRPSGYLADRQPLEIGPFRVTSYLVDHSAFESFALLVEADGRRLFYSGDVRAHGRKARAFERFLASPPERIDALLLEGTRLGRQETGGCASEDEVELRATEVMQGAGEAMALLFYSPQNVDRYVSLYRAAIRAGRVFVIDLYAAAVASATGRDTIPQASWRNVRVLVPRAQSIRVKQAKAFERIDAIRGWRIYAEELLADHGRFALTFRVSMTSEFERAGMPEATAIWSMWPGYLSPGPDDRLNYFLARNEVPLEVIHTSGHAPVDDLKRFAEAIGPARVIPIHTEHPERYRELYERVEPHADGEWWEV